MKMDTYRNSILIEKVLKLVEEELSVNGNMYGLNIEQTRYLTKARDKKINQMTQNAFKSYTPSSMMQH